MSRINVTKSYLPPYEEYEYYLKGIWNRGYLTNQGPLLHEFQNLVEQKLDLKNFHFISNGTIAIQIAFKALGITEGEVITTPFSYVATTSAILWEHLTPVYADIDDKTFCIDAQKIEDLITTRTKAILAVHVFGNACDVENIERIAKKYNLKVIYDAAHAFGATYKGKSLLSYGDISTVSFHATKLIHTIEGGGIVCKNKDISNKVELIKRFGHDADEHIMLGINAKSSEFQAAMGLCTLNHLDEIIRQRKKLTLHYDKYLKPHLTKQLCTNDTLNYSYYPVVFINEQTLLSVKSALEANEIFPRRYFYPSLNNLGYLEEISKVSCPASESLTKRILCLPLYPDLEIEVVERISEIVLKHVQS
ncbi:DegT/DnrJ/EryC1/StrS family aminotransferase [bacterium]|nr:DegT/DnrJ/EryC1/StrS family aminotransferase [bacterium]